MRIVLSIAAFMLLVSPVAAQSEAEMKEIVGGWQLQFTTPDGIERSPVVVIGRQHQELVAWAIDEGDPEAFKSVRLDGDTLVLTLRPRKQEGVTVTLKATQQTDGVCVGTGTYQSDDGDSGSWDFEGKRLSPSEFGETEQWQLSFVAPDGQQYKTLVTAVEVDDHLYGWCSTKDLELLATKLTYEGDNVVMSVTSKTSEGESVDTTFRGRVSGDRISGEAEYDVNGQTGTFTFTGQRKS